MFHAGRESLTRLTAVLPRLQPVLKIAVKVAACMVHEHLPAVVDAEKNRFVPIPVQGLRLFQRQDVDVFHISDVNHGQSFDVTFFFGPVEDRVGMVEVIMPTLQQHGVVQL